MAGKSLLVKKMVEVMEKDATRGDVVEDEVDVDGDNRLAP